MSGDPLRDAAEARRQREGEARREQAQREKENRERAMVIEQHRAQASAMLEKFLGKMATAGYPGVRPISVSRGLLRRTTLQCWEGWLTTDGEMIGVPAGTHGVASKEHLSSPEEWLPRRIDDIYHDAHGSTSAHTTPVETQLEHLAETLDRILASNGIEI